MLLNYLISINRLKMERDIQVYEKGRRSTAVMNFLNPYYPWMFCSICNFTLPYGAVVLCHSYRFRTQFRNIRYFTRICTFNVIPEKLIFKWKIKQPKQKSNKYKTFFIINILSLYGISGICNKQKTLSNKFFSN